MSMGPIRGNPDTVSQYFARLLTRLDLDHLEFKGLPRFTNTYGQSPVEPATLSGRWPTCSRATGCSPSGSGPEVRELGLVGVDVDVGIGEDELVVEVSRALDCRLADRFDFRPAP